MALKQQIQEAVKESLKAGDQMTLGTLRILLAAVATREKEKRFKIVKEKQGIAEADLQVQSELSDDEIVETISSEIKKRRDAIVLYNQGKRPELAEREESEIKVLQRYLPEQLSQDEIRQLAAESIERLGAKEIKDMGKVMADLNPKVKGRAEGSQVSKIIKELLLK